MLIPTPKPDNPELKHLFIILTKPVNGKIAMVNLSSCKNNFYDKSCVLNSNDHKFIKAKSYIAYQYATIIETNKLQSMAVYDMVNDAVFKKICAGLLASKRTKPEVKTFYIDYLKQN